MNQTTNKSIKEKLTIVSSIEGLALNDQDQKGKLIIQNSEILIETLTFSQFNPIDILPSYIKNENGIFVPENKLRTPKIILK